MDQKFSIEILFQILIKLPVLSLIRLMCVSKFWYDLISSLDFIDINLRHNYNQICDNYTALFTKSTCLCMRETYSLHVDSEEFQIIEKYQSPNHDFTLFGCANGLICLERIDMIQCSNSLMFWNPIIRKCFYLPEIIGQPAPINNASGQMSVAVSRLWDYNFGFGYDVLSSDFKVVRIIAFQMKVDNPTTNDDIHHEAFFTVFSLKTKLWKPLQNCAPMHLLSRGCNVGRFVYRLALIPNSNPKVVSFDLSTDEVFSEIDFPKSDVYVPVTKVELSNFRGTLGLIQKLDYTRYDWWTLWEDGEAKSWRKNFKLHLEGPWQSIAGFTMKGRMIVVCDGYVLEGEEMDEAHNLHCEKLQQEWQVDSFKESLALLDDGVAYP